MQQETPKRTSYGAWKKQTPRGEVINFTLNGQRYNMWFNSKKTQEKQPDYNIYEDNYVSPSQVVQTQDVQAQGLTQQAGQTIQGGMNPMAMAMMLRKGQGTNPYLGAAKAMLQYGPENVYGYGGQGQVPFSL